VTIKGESVEIRAIRPEDERLWTEMVESLSPTTAGHRFFGPLGKVGKAMLVRYCHIDYDREIALVAVRDGERGSGPVMLGVASLTIENGDAEAGEFAIVVRDDSQHKGIGRALMDALIAVARGRGVREIDGYVLAANPGMLRFVTSLGFAILPGDEPETRHVVLRL
jgi:acetyltransferase